MVLGFERLSKTWIHYKELDTSIDILKEALAKVINRPNSCRQYDESALLMLDTNREESRKLEMGNSEISETWCSRYISMRNQIASIHSPLCPNFLQHPLQPI